MKSAIVRGRSPKPLGLQERSEKVAQESCREEEGQEVKHGSILLLEQVQRVNQGGRQGEEGDGSGQAEDIEQRGIHERIRRMSRCPIRSQPHRKP